MLKTLIEAVCRIALDFMLNECLTVLKGNNVASEESHETSDRLKTKTPTPYDDIRIYGEVSFDHDVLASRFTVSGRLDYGIGRILKPVGGAEAWRRRRFQCFMVIVSAKAQFAAGSALPQLLVYLASLHQSRLRRGRTDASVYGVSSDGYQYIFVTITHNGTVKVSRLFDIVRNMGDMEEVLGWLTWMLEMTPNVTPESNSGDEKVGEDLDDPMIDPDDSDYMSPPDNED